MCKSEHIDNMLLLPGPFGRLRHGAQWPNGLETLSIRACVSVRVCVRVCVCVCVRARIVFQVCRTFPRVARKQTQTLQSTSSIQQ